MRVCRVTEASGAHSRYEHACEQLRAGNYKHGFRNYESRWEAAGIPRPVHTDRALLGPEWRGQDLRGKRILLHAEQGFGDTVQFLRYVPLVTQLGAAEVTVEVQPELRTLVAGMPSGFTLGTGTPAGKYDFHCSLLDLPIAFRTTLSTIPKPVHLELRETVLGHWQARIGRTRRMRIGLVWGGNPRNSTDAKRSVNLHALSPLLSTFTDADFFSFQVGPPARQLKECEGPVIDLKPFLTDFVETAAALRQMDRIISVDTAVAHLAGSLGLGVFLLLCHRPCWRWLLETKSSPWYPTMKLIRQPSPGDWPSVIENLKKELYNTKQIGAKSIHEESCPARSADHLLRLGRILLQERT